MRKEIDLSEVFKMDRTVVKTFASFEEAEEWSENWLDRPVEERLHAVEFLRQQWIAWNKLSARIEKVVSSKSLHE